MTVSKELIDKIIEHEGSMKFAYKCSQGKTTIGIGRNIDKEGGKGLSIDEQQYLLNNDINDCEKELSKYPWYTTLDKTRQEALIELCFNMGISRLLNFKKMILAITNKDFHLATHELLDSLWAKQVQKSRVENIRFRLLNGLYK